jgi:hypothetical protein
MEIAAIIDQTRYIVSGIGRASPVSTSNTNNC